MRAAAEPERTRLVNYPTGLLEAEEQTSRADRARKRPLDGERRRFRPSARVMVAALILLVLIAAMMMGKVDIGNFLL
jgi:hypothetical protein